VGDVQHKPESIVDAHHAPPLAYTQGYTGVGAPDRCLGVVDPLLHQTPHRLYDVLVQLQNAREAAHVLILAVRTRPLEGSRLGLHLLGMRLVPSAAVARAGRLILLAFLAGQARTR
jgi:hypothetical protein